MDLTIFDNSNSQKRPEKTLFKEIKIEFNFKFNLFISIYKVFAAPKKIKFYLHSTPEITSGDACHPDRI